MNINKFKDHPITQKVMELTYIAGSYIINPDSIPEIEVLGWIDQYPVMGIVHHLDAKVFFICDLNCFKKVSQPFTKNLFDWAFD